jgi:hypothetical protein
MIAFAWILMLAVSSRVQLVDEVYQIPANEWRYIPVEFNQHPARVSARYDVLPPPGQVKVAFMRRDELERLRAGAPHGVLDETAPGSVGSLFPHVYDPGEYVIVVANGAETAAAVRLRVWLDFDVHHGRQVTRLSRERQLTVILLSFAVFFGIVTWSARKLLRGIQRPGA